MKIIISIVLFCSFLYSADKLKIAGSTTIQPVIEELSQLYFDTTGTKLTIEGLGSQKGIDALGKNNVDIAMVSRDLSPEEKSKFIYKTIGYDAVAIVVNKNNPIHALSKKDIVNIYTQTTKNWKQLGGKNETILPISKQQDRGTMHIFEHYFGLFHPKNPKNSDTSKMITGQAWESGANSEVIIWVSGIPSAIGFVSFGSAKSATDSGIPLKIVTVDDLYPDYENIKNRSYPLSRPLNLVYNKKNLKAKKFVDWMLEDIAQMIIEQNYFVGVAQ